MALEAHVLLDGSKHVMSFHRLSDAIGELNAASFAGVGGVAVIAVGRQQQEAYERVVAFTGEEATAGDSAIQ